MTPSQDILAKLEDDILAGPDESPAPLQIDKWLASSCMQKAIRRQHTETALRAATTLWLADKNNFHRRIMTIAVEDIGIGDVDAVTKTLAAITASTWRRRIGCLRVGLYLTKLLSNAVKSRLADEVYIAAEKDVRYSNLRHQLAIASDAAITGLVFDNRRSITEKALFQWYIAGTRRFPTELMPQRSGSLEQAVAVMRMMCAPPELIEACVSVVTRTGWPLHLIFPLLYQESTQHPLTVQVHDLAPAPSVAGVPVWAADQYSRLGKCCIRQLKTTVAGLKRFSTGQIGLALFYTDGALVDRELTTPALKEIQQASELADTQASGLSLIEYDDLRHRLLANMPLLNDIREAQLREYIKTGTPNSSSTCSGSEEA